jgi:hypothetical protein
MSAVTDTRTLGELFSDLSREISTIVRKELELARSELSGKAGRLGAQAGLIVGGAVLAGAGFLAVVAGTVLLLVRLGMPPWGAALLVGIALLVVGAAIAQRAYQRLSTIDLTPRRTIRTMKENVTWTRAHTT